MLCINMHIQSITIAQSKTPIINKNTPQVPVLTNSYSNSNAILNSLSFLGNYNVPFIQKDINVPIRDDEEYDEVMQRVYSALTENGNIMWIPKDYRSVISAYKDASDIEMGLVTYCGACDCSEIINMYLSGRLNDEEIRKAYRGLLPQDMDSCVDVVRALDYSLKHLDEEFGTYNGIVYRRGYMKPGNGQFYSTSKNPALVQYKNMDSKRFNPSEGYSVIRVKDAHKIYKFQEKMCDEFANTEEEVLIGRDADANLVTNDLDDELSAAREELAKHLFIGADEIMNGVRNTPYTRDQLLSFIDVYDAI